MNTVSLDAGCPGEVSLRIEKKVLRASVHPALRHALNFIDVQRQAVMVAILVLLGVLVWRVYIIDVAHVVAPMVK